MKKIFSVLVALTMLFALCVPAFAGEAMEALTDPNAKAIATALEQYINTYAYSFADDAGRTEAAKFVATKLPLDNFGEEMKNAISVEAAVNAFATDYSEAIAEEDTAALKDALMAEIRTAYANRPGVSTYDPSQVVDNIADGFSDNDLSGLFDTLRNTITDLSDRLSGAFASNSTPSGDDTTGDTPNSSDSTSNGNNEYGGKEPTGDTAVYAVASVAAVAAVALVVTKKKSK